ncbi:MAG: VWA domain-containing protein [Acidobacteria bacterium]|nr:VWA domain-containing protein [Acidobacteriota bacterium]
MKKLIALLLSSALLSTLGVSQTTTPGSQEQTEEIVRITSALVQTDVVVTDKNDQLVKDLKLGDFEVYENGKKQDLKFLEFVSVNEGRRSEGQLPATLASTSKLGGDVARDVSAKDLKQVIAFVVDDLTIPTEDLYRTRQMLTDFVDNKMRDGDLVAIVRVVGGQGLLQQFTSDRQLLRRAIAGLSFRTNPYTLASDIGGDRITSLPRPAGDTQTLEASGGAAQGPGSGFDIENANDDTNRTVRAMMTLSTANFVIESLKSLPGRKNLVLVSGGLPLFDSSQSGREAQVGVTNPSVGGISTIIGNITQLVNYLIGNATRAGVVVNTLDVRGLKATGAVARFVDTPGKSALGGGTLAGSDENASFGRSADTALLGRSPAGDQAGLRELAERTGGVSIINSNNFGTGLDKVLTRSSGYYRLAYTPFEKFDDKFRKIEVKVRRSGTRVYAAAGYVARDERSDKPRTKEEEIIAATRSPLAKRDLDVAAALQYKFVPEKNQAEIDVNTLVDAHKLNFKQSPDGKYQASFDIAGFIFDELGRSRGGISQTVNATLTPEGYQRALATGISYSASTQLPPGYYQVRLAVREAGTGNVGTVSRYFEVPDLTNKRLAASSLYLYAIEQQPGSKTAPQSLGATPRLTRKQDLRYAVVVYNAKLANNQPQLRSQLIIAQNGKVLFQEPEQPVETKGSSATQWVKVGQLGLSKVMPGRYLITVVVTDPLADKKYQKLARSAEFVVE